MKRKITSRRGISTIVADLMILTIIAAMGSVVLVWTLNSYSDYRNQASSYTTGKAEAINEILIIEHAWFNDTDSNGLYDQAKLYLRNIGNVALIVTETDVNGLPVNETSPSLPLSLSLDQSCELTVIMSNELSEGTVVYVTVLSDRGNTFTSYFEIG